MNFTHIVNLTHNGNNLNGISHSLTTNQFYVNPIINHYSVIAYQPNKWSSMSKIVHKSKLVIHYVKHHSQIKISDSLSDIAHKLKLVVHYIGHYSQDKISDLLHQTLLTNQLSDPIRQSSLNNRLSTCNNHKCMLVQL